MRIAEILTYLKEQDLSFTFEGDPEVEVEGFSSLSHYKEGSFSWIKAQKNIPDGFDLSKIRLAFVSEDVVGNFQNVIRTPQSKHAFFSTMEYFYGQEEERSAIGQFTYISPKVKLGKNVRIGHNCTLDGDITIGDNTIIWNNVTMVNRVRIGSNCEIQSGTVIGHDGFGYTEDAHHNKTMVKHFGGVMIGDAVTILENCNISRGVIDDTEICSGTKIDAGVRVGHNCIIGKDSAFVTGTMIYGSCYFGQNSYVATSIIKNQTHVGDNAFVGMGAVVLKDVPAGETVVGNPAKTFLKRKD